MTRYLMALAEILTLAGAALAQPSQAPPVMVPPQAPAVEKVAPVEVSDARKACVRVSTASGRGFEFSGGGTCVWAGDGESLVLTNNHIFSEQHHPQGGFRDDVYPQKATVTTAAGKTYKATAVAADRTADIAVVVVEGELAAAAIAEELPQPGEVVWRSGMGSGYQTCRVVTAEASRDSMGFNVVGKSESGDSGSGYFNAKDELVAVHCGKNTQNQPRGTPVTVAKSVVKTRTPLLFPRLRARLAGAKEPPPVPMATPPKVAPKKVEAPKAAPKQVLWRLPDGTFQYLPEGVVPGASAAPSCPGGNCQIPSTRRGFFR